MTKITASRSFPEALDAWTKHMSRQMQMAAEDGQRLFSDWQDVTQRIAGSFAKGWPSAGTQNPSSSAADPADGPRTAKENGATPRARADNAGAAPRQSNELAKRIRKLRWIGMEDEAHQLQREVRRLPPEQVGTVSEGPFSTD